MNVIIYILGIFSALHAFLFSFPFYTDTFYLMIVCLAFCMIQYILYYYIKNKKSFYTASILLSVSLMIFSLSGLSYVKDVILQKYMNVSVYTFSISGTYHYHNDFFMNLLSMLSLVIPINTLNIYFFCNKKYILSAISLFPFIFVEILFTITPPLYCTPYILYCLIMVLSKRQTKIKILPIILSISFMLSLFYIVPPSSYFHPKQERQYEDPLHSSPRQEDGEYDLMKQGNRYYTNGVDLVVSGIMNSSFLLRGMVYDDFDGIWHQTTAKKSYDYPYAHRIRALGQHSQCQTQNITISDLHHRNVVYTPYFYQSSSQTLKYFYSHFEGEKNEDFEMIIPNQRWNDYLKLDIDDKYSYNDLLELNPLNNLVTDSEPGLIPNDTRDILMTFITKHHIDEYTTFEDLIERTKKALFEETSYTLIPGVTPSNENFFDYFLNKNKKGYCVHYASTFALILRLMGYKADFVTGYQVNSKYSDQNYINVLDSCAHAWVEISDPILGIIPLEVTPSVSSISTHEEVTPQTPTVPNTDDTDDFQPTQDDVIEEEENFEIPFFIYPLIAVIAILITIHLQSRIRYRRQFYHLDNNQKVCKMYYHLNHLNLDIAKEITKTAKKAKFSSHQINDEEYQQSNILYNEALKTAYHQSSIINKFKLKYIYAYI